MGRVLVLIILHYIANTSCVPGVSTLRCVFSCVLYSAVSCMVLLLDLCSVYSFYYIAYCVVVLKFLQNVGPPSRVLLLKVYIFISKF